MSTITDELIDTQLPDKISGKYKPKRMRTLLKGLTEQILLETQGKNIQRINFSVGLGPAFASTTVSQVAGFNSFVKKVVYKLFNYDGTPIPAGENISIKFGNVSLYDGPILPAISIPGSDHIVFAETDFVEATIAVTGVNEYIFQGAIFIEEI